MHGCIALVHPPPIPLSPPLFGVLRRGLMGGSLTSLNKSKRGLYSLGSLPGVFTPFTNLELSLLFCCVCMV